MSHEEFYKERLHIYNLLRQLYLSPPSEEILSALQKIEVGEEVCLAESDVTKGLRMLKEVGADKLEELSLEFAGLFIGPGKIPIPPYESFYTSEKRLLMQEATIAVRKKYLKAGLVMKNLYSSPEDHIASEFEFMYFLCQKEAEARGKSNGEQALEWLEMQQEFLKEHLSAWIPAFCKDLEQAAESDFYKGVAKVTKAYLSLEQETIGELLAQNFSSELRQDI